MFSLLNSKINLPPGKYIFMIDPIWNQTSLNDQLYQEVLVDIYAPDSVNLTQIDDHQGMQVLARAMKNAAMTLSPEE